MPLTFGLTGMDPSTESTLKTAFDEANARLGGAWQLLPETEAHYVVVDMDSLYGPMSWLRLHAAGKTVIGLTNAPRTQTDYHLLHPFDGDSVAQLLQQLASRADQPLHMPATSATAESHAAPAPAGLTPAPQPQDLLPEEQPLPPDEEVAPPAEPTAVAVSHDAALAAEPREPPSAAVGQIIPPAPTIEARTPPPAPVEVKEPATLTEWLASGKLKGRLRFQRDGNPLLINLDRQEYFGPPSLKPLAAQVKGAASADDFQPVDTAEWSHETAALGAAQPLMRLVWFGNLLGGEGKLVTGFDPEGRFQMIKWPQTERDYPKHFRIATVMMKGPATLAEIAQTSGVPLADVIDFVNASLATGFADIERIPEPEPEPVKPTSLFDRLRGR